MKLSNKEFDKIVQRAIRRIPDEIRQHLDNILITVQQWPDPELLEEMCVSLEELEEEIEITVVHEIAHFIGISEERLAELGYE
jgi:predicted Zn-dependent protease with MMP-like domain